MPIALTSDQADLAAAVAGFTARHADIAATRAAFDKIASGEPQPSWQAAVGIALDTITVLGGIGYTWEHDVHLYWRRAMSLAALLGPAGAWRKRLTSLSRATGRHHDLPLVDEPAGLRAAVAPVLAEARASPTLASGAVSWPPAASRPRTTRTRTASAPARPPRS